MSVRTNEKYEEAEREGRTELVLVAVTYTGDRSTYSDESIRTQGGYPSLDGFQQDQTKLVKLPSERLGWWERRGDFEIAYDEISMAECLLEQNFIPQQIIGPGYDAEIRDKLMDKLGLEPATDEEGYREQLRDLVGIDPDEVTEEQDATANDRLESLVGEDRSILIKVANSYDDDIEDYLDEVDKGSVSHLSQHEAAEFLAGKEDDAVDNRIEKAEMGQEL